MSPLVGRFGTLCLSEVHIFPFRARRSLATMDQTRRSRPSARNWKTELALVAVILGLMICLAWNLTRTDAIAAAHRAISGANWFSRSNSPSTIAIDDRGAERRRVAAHCLSRLDYAEEAEPYFQRAGRLELNDQQIRAYGLARSRYPERAIQAYTEILARRGECDRLRRLAAVRLGRNNTDDLLKLADRLSHVPNGAVLGQTLRGLVFHNENNPQRAIECFEQVLVLDPDLREMPLSRRLFWTHLSDDLITDGRIDDARRQIYSRPLPEFTGRRSDGPAGSDLLSPRHLEDAERCFRQAAEWDPTDYKPHFDLSKHALQRQQQRGGPDASERSHTACTRALRSSLQSGVGLSATRANGRCGPPATDRRFKLREKPNSSSSEPVNGVWPRLCVLTGTVVRRSNS